MFNEKDLDVIIESTLLSDCIEPSIMREYAADELDETISRGIEEHVRECDICQRILGAIDEKKLAKLLKEQASSKQTSPLANQILIKKGYWSDVARMLTEEFFEGDEKAQEEIVAEWDTLYELYWDFRTQVSEIRRAAGFGLESDEGRLTQTQVIITVMMSVCDRLNQKVVAIESRVKFNKAVYPIIGTLGKKLSGKLSDFLNARILNVTS